MSWAKFDDRARENLKVRRAGTNGLALWAAAIMWCSEHKTDGHVPKDMIGDVWRPMGETFDAPAAARACVAAGLFEDRGPEFIVHDFLDYNPSKAEQVAKKKAAADRARRYRQRKTSPVTRSVTRDGARDSRRDDSQVPGGGEEEDGVTRDVTRSVTLEEPCDVTQAPSLEVRSASVTLPRPVPSPTRTRPVPVRTYAREGVGKDLNLARTLLTSLYQERYEREADDVWMGAGKAFSDIGTCAAWVIAKGPDQIEARATSLVEGIFSDPWLSDNGWPWGAVARDPARVAAGRGRRKRSARLPPGDGEGFSEDDFPEAKYG